jgi:hypothetical protein
MTGIEESDIEKASSSFNYWWSDWKKLMVLILVIAFVHTGMLLIQLIWVGIESIRKMVVSTRRTMSKNNSHSGK